MRILACLAVCSALTVRGQYQGPESVEYDPAGDRYFVSTTTGASIKVRDQAGTVTNFVNVSPAPYGLEIMGDTLFACSGGSIKGYALSNGALVFNLNLGATFLNGITTDGQYLYATDFNSGQRKVYKVDVAGNSSSVLVANTGAQPNGIVWDPSGDRLVVVFWGSNAPIKAYDRNTGAETVLVANSGVGNIDGVTIDCQGGFLIASWSPARITRFEPTFIGGGFNMNVPGLNNPADIDFDLTNNRICIPNAGSNTVVLHEFNCASGIGSSTGTSVLRAIPNPTDDVIRFEPEFTRPEPYLLLDGRGLLIGGGTLSARAQLDVRTLERGTYVLDFTRAGRQVRFVKE